MEGAVRSEAGLRLCDEEPRLIGRGRELSGFPGSPVLPEEAPEIVYSQGCRSLRGECNLT